MPDVAAAAERLGVGEFEGAPLDTAGFAVGEPVVELPLDDVPKLSVAGGLEVFEVAGGGDETGGRATGGGATGGGEIDGWIGGGEIGGELVSNVVVGGGVVEFGVKLTNRRAVAEFATDAFPAGVPVAVPDVVNPFDWLAKKLSLTATGALETEAAASYAA
jgi:hypothetical protein